jgi:hypothetical protein
MEIIKGLYSCRYSETLAHGGRSGENVKQKMGVSGRKIAAVARAFRIFSIRKLFWIGLAQADTGACKPGRNSVRNGAECGKGQKKQETPT